MKKELKIGSKVINFLLQYKTETRARTQKGEFPSGMIDSKLAGDAALSGIKAKQAKFLTPLVLLVRVTGSNLHIL